MERAESSIRRWALIDKIIWLVYMAVSFIVWVVRPYFMNRGIVAAFYTKQGDMAYIYKVLDYLWSESRLIGSSMTEQQIKSILPEYNSACIFTYIAAGCGKLISIACGVLLVSVIIIGIGWCRKSRLPVRYITASILVQILMMVLALLLQNWQLMPFVFYLF